jgi:hypothetical protein
MWDEGNDIHLLLKCTEMQRERERERENFWNGKWLNINEEAVYEKVIM